MSVFDLMQSIGGVEETEMFRSFNMGIGMIIIVDPKFTDIALKTDKDSKIIGKIFNRSNNEEKVNIIGIWSESFSKRI